ncbi:MAG: tetratricopeptide repeat protein [Candidatus Cloacimonetes bacterium]|nr:tetratricopeptide repeat protein [Candidatus Cloacimonadota bacterium]
MPDALKCAKKAFELKLTQRVWFERRYAMCLAKLGRMQEAFELYQKLAAQKGEWYIYFETGLAAFRLQEYQSAEAYAMKAMFAPGKIEAKIHLWELLRDLMSHNKQYELAIELLSLIAAIRQQMHWSISSELMKELASYNLVLDQLRPYKDILHTIKQKLKASLPDSPKNTGTISKMLPNNVAGFIACEDHSYYFRAMDCKGFQPTVNQKVSFDLIDSFDAKKQQKDPARDPYQKGSIMAVVYVADQGSFISKRVIASMCIKGPCCIDGFIPRISHP